MKVLYLEARRKQEKQQELGKEFIEILPRKLFLAYSIQYKESAESIKKQLESNKIKITGFQSVLGCTKLKSNFPILLIGSGRFHALNLARQTGQEVYIYNNSLARITKEEIADFNKKKTGLLSKLLVSDKIGILVSTKPGQNNLSRVLKLKEQLKSMKKQVYIFISNNFNTAEFENFQIDLWINSACPGMENDSANLLNIDDISENLFTGKHNFTETKSL